MKKFLLGIATFITMAVLCVVSAGAETYGDYRYTVLDDGTVEITGYTGSATELEIPAQIDGKTVTSIGDFAFNQKSALTSINLPDTITNIGDYSFSRCSSLTSITIPDSVTNIGESAFYTCYSLTSVILPEGITSLSDSLFSSCTSLKSITIPNDVAVIGNKVFYWCTHLTSVTMPDNITTIGDEAFHNCCNLTSITIPNSVTSIGEKAFCWCSQLTSITIPDNVTSIGNQAFTYCHSLEEITVVSKNKYFASADGILFNKDKTTLINYPIGKETTSYTIPNSVTYIDCGAFVGAVSYLTSVTIPDSVTSIGDEAFYSCKSLESITIGNGVTSIGDCAFYWCDALTTINIPKNVKDIGKAVFGSCKELTSITVDPDNECFTSVDGILFNKNKTELIRYPAGKTTTSYTTPDSITNIKGGAFVYCANLESIIISDGVISIEDIGYGCSSLVSITIPASVTSICEYAFGYGVIGNDYMAKYEDLVIYCYKDSAAHKYATDYGFDFELLGLAPTAVKGLSLGGRSGNALRLNWTKNTSADGYIIEMYKGGKWTRIARIAGNATTTYRVTGLAAGTAYKFRMKAYKMDGAKALYSEYTSTFVARTNPSVVTGLKIGGRASNALRLNWTKNTSADGYIVEMYKGGKWVRVARIAGNSTTTYRVSGLAASTQYKFRVKAYKMSGKTALYSGYTSTLAAYTNPSAVSNLKITGKAGTALRLGWSKNTSADGYIVEMYSGGKWVRVAKITSNATVTYRKAGLKKGTTYKFRVATYNVAGGTAYYGAYVNVSGTTNK